LRSSAGRSLALDALLLDSRSRVIRHVPLDDPSIRVLVVNSGVNG
jgi:hypothetical protein